MQSLKQISIDLMQRGATPVIDAKQNDRDARGIIASVYNGSVPFSVPSGATAIFRYKKPDGTAGFYDTLEDNSTPAVTVSGNTVTVIFVEQVLTVAGLVQGEINFYTSAGEKLTSFTLSIQVQASVLSDATIISSNYYNILTAQVAQTLEYKNAAAQSAQAAATSAQSAADSAALAQQVSQQGKGWFATDTALKQAFPTGQNGWWAIVGANDNIWTWDADTSSWVNTHTQTDLSNYYTKQQADAQFAPIATQCPTGAIIQFASENAPSGWLVCNGAAVSRTAYAALFSVIGTTYGVGDTSTTFNLPDLRGRVPLGYDANHALGVKIGFETHRHHSPVGFGGSEIGLSNDYQFDDTERKQILSAARIGAPTQGDAQYWTDSASNIQPSIGVNFIIKF